MSSISTDDVRHVARLARLSVDDEQLKVMTSELDSILEAIGKISDLDLTDVAPTTHALDVTNAWVADVPRASLDPAEALRNAPDPADDGFRVPRMQS